MPEIRLIVNEEDTDTRLDVYLAENTPLSRTAIQKLIESGEVRVNDERSNKKYLTCADDVIVFSKNGDDRSSYSIKRVVAVGGDDRVDKYGDPDEIRTRRHGAAVRCVFFAVHAAALSAGHVRRAAPRPAGGSHTRAFWHIARPARNCS